MFSLGKLVNNVHSEKALQPHCRSASLEKNSSLFLWETSSVLQGLLVVPKYCTPFKKLPALSTMETPLGVLFLRHRVFYECLCFIRIAPIREMELWKPEQKGTEDSL